MVMTLSVLQSTEKTETNNKLMLLTILYICSQSMLHSVVFMSVREHHS